MACLQGCRTWITDRNKDSSDSPAPSVLFFEKQAINHENEQELQLALANWKIAEVMMKKRIGSLTRHIEENAENHYRNGLELLKQGQNEQASMEFLKTLRYDCLHRDALKSLKSLNAYRTVSYTVKPGDTFTQISEQVYRTREYGFIVSYFSGIDDNRDLKAGADLTLPVLDVAFTKRFFNFQKEIAAARTYYKQKEYSRALLSAENIIRHRPGHDEALFIINSSYDTLAEQQVKKQRYDDAIAMLEKIDPNFKNVKNRIKEIQDIQKRSKEAVNENKNATHYQAGLDFFDQKKYIKALDAFEKVEPSYGDIADKLSELKRVMTIESEEHYRKGVKHFLNEKLDEAIEEWEKALALDPENDKARKDIDNARQLLKKIDEIN